MGVIPDSVNMVETELLQSRETFLNQSGMSQSGFGLRALNDGKFLSRLRAGSSVTLRTQRKILAFINSHRQPGLSPPTVSR